MGSGPNRRDVLKSVGLTVGGLATAGQVSATGQNRIDRSGFSQTTDGTPTPTGRTGGRFAVEQGGSRYEVAPLSTGETIETFYDYYDVESHTTTDFERPNVSHLFFWVGPKGLSLVMIHDRRDDGSGGAVTFEFENLPESGSWAVRDDDPGNDNYSPSMVDWQWNGSHTDGGAFRGDIWDSEIVIHPNFQEGIDEWQLLSCGAKSPRGITLDMDEPVTVDIPPRPGTEATELTMLTTVPAFPNPDEPVEAVGVIAGGTGTTTATLFVGGERAAQQQVSLREDGPTLVRWTPGRVLEPGTHSLRAVVGNSSEACATVRVPKLALHYFYTQPVGGDLDAGEAELAAGNTETVVELENPAEEAVETTLTLTIDGDTAAKRELTMPPATTLRPMFPWNAERGKTHKLQLEVDIADAGSYALEGAYNSLGRRLPTAAAFSAGTAPQAGGHRKVMLARLMAYEDVIYDPIEGALYAPTSGKGEVTFRVLDQRGNELGSTTATVDTTYEVNGTEKVSPNERQWVKIPVRASLTDQYFILHVEETQNLAESIGTTFGGGALSLVGRAGALVDSYVSAASGQRYAPADAPYEEPNALTYQHVVVGEVSGYPESTDLKAIRNKAGEAFRRQYRWNTATDAIKDLVGIILPELTDETAGLAMTVVSAGETASEYTLDTGVSVELSNPSFTNEAGVGKLESYDYGTDDPGVGGDIIDDQRLAPIRVVDLKATGLSGGSARVRVHYSDEDLAAAGIKDQELTFQYWADEHWQTGENVQVSPETSEVSAEIPVSDLSGTPIVVAGPNKQDGGLLSNPLALGGGALAALGAGYALLRRKGIGNERQQYTGGGGGRDDYR